MKFLVFWACLFLTCLSALSPSAALNLRRDRRPPLQVDITKESVENNYRILDQVISR